MSLDCVKPHHCRLISAWLIVRVHLRTLKSTAQWEDLSFPLGMDLGMLAKSAGIYPSHYLGVGGVIHPKKGNAYIPNVFFVIGSNVALLIVYLKITTLHKGLKVTIFGSGHALPLKIEDPDPC